MSILGRAIRTWETRPYPTLALPMLSWRQALLLAIAAGLLALFASAAAVLWTDILQTYEQRSAFEPREGRGDFIAFYVAGEFALEGRGDEIYDLDSLARRENELMPPTDAESRQLPFYNPPFVAAIFAAISLLPYDSALWAWLVINVVVLAACVVALDRLLSRESPLLRVLFALGAISSVPVYRAIGLGQASLFVLLFSTLAFTWLSEHRDRRAGVMVGLLLVKPQYALLPAIHLLATRRREAILALVALAVGGIVASVIVSGPSVIVEYSDLLLESSSWREERGIYPENWFSWTGFFFSLKLSSTSASVLGLVLGGAATALALLVSARVDRGDGVGVLAAGATLTVAILLLSPHVYRQDLVLLLFPAAVLLAFTSGTDRVLACMMLLVLWLAAWAPLPVPAVPEPAWQELRLEDLGFNLFVPLIAALLVTMVVLTLRISRIQKLGGSTYDGLDATKCSGR